MFLFFNKRLNAYNAGASAIKSLSSQNWKEKKRGQIDSNKLHEQKELGITRFDKLEINIINYY